MIITYNENSKKLFKRSLIIISLIVFVFIICLIMLKYEVEGENIESLPFKISEMKIASKVDLNTNEDSENIWNITPIQINDVYLKIETNDNKKIERVTIKDIIIDKPEGIISKITTLKDHNMENMDTIEYIGKNVTNIENLSISEKGGTIGFSYVIEKLGNYISNENEIKYNMELLEKLGITREEIKSKLTFNVIVEVESTKYATTIDVELPTKDSQIEDVNLTGIIFKRILQN